MNICYIPISLGELYDKYSILIIKSNKINDKKKLIEINKEISFLKPFIDKFNLSYEIQEKLKNINERLWNIENDIREKENKNEFDNDFIQLSRLVYKTNDLRAKIKDEINKVFNSEINEIKSYV
jgi:hypothetical protein